MDVARAIKSVQRSQCCARFFVVDNSPTDSLRTVATGRGVSYVHNAGRNIGFGAGHNRAIRQALEFGLDYHVIVNPDVYFDQPVVEALVSYLDEHAEVGAIMPRVLFTDGSLQHLCRLPPRPFDLICRRFFPQFVKKVFQRRMESFEMRQLTVSAPADVPILSGCFLLVRTQALRQIGGFDERFFLYLEDYDLCNRMRQTHRLIYYPMVAVLHRHGRHSYKRFKPLMYHIHSAVKYFNKWGWRPLY